MYLVYQWIYDYNVCVKNIDAAFWKYVSKSVDILHESHAIYKQSTVREACLEACQNDDIIKLYQSVGININVKHFARKLKHGIDIQDSETETMNERIENVKNLIEHCRIKIESTDAYQHYAEKELKQLILQAKKAVREKERIKYPQFIKQFEMDEKRWQEEQDRREKQQANSVPNYKPNAPQQHVEKPHQQQSGSSSMPPDTNMITKQSIPPLQ